MQESKVEYFKRKMDEYSAWRTEVEGRKWDTYKDDWFATERTFFYAGMKEFFDWLKDSE